MRRFLVHTMGCKANTYDSQLVEQALQEKGLERAAEGASADVIIVNSCTVTEEADRQSRKMASRLARRHPNATVVMTGCGAEVEPERHAATPGVDLVVGNQDKPALASLIAPKLADDDSNAEPAIGGNVRRYDKKRARHPTDRAWPSPEQAFFTPPVQRGKTRVFLKIQEGCDAFCTYCIIPYARGPARNLRPIDLVRQVREVCNQGATEVVLTGTALGDYGDDLADDIGLEALLKLLLRETPIQRLRTSSLDPKELSPELIALMVDEPRLCPHVHVSLQSPVTPILKRMKRRYTAHDVEATLSSLKEASAHIERIRELPGGVFVGMDLITGFPGESDALFQETVDRLKRSFWTRLHVFPFSEREGTAATRLDQPVAPRVRKARVKILTELSRQRVRSHYERVLSDDRPLRVLVEGQTNAPVQLSGRVCVGAYSDNYLRVIAPPLSAAEPQRNTIWWIQPTGLVDVSAVGDVALTGKWLMPHERGDKDGPTSHRAPHGA